MPGLTLLSSPVDSTTAMEELMLHLTACSSFGSSWATVASDINEGLLWWNIAIERVVQPSMASMVELAPAAFKTSMVSADPFFAAQCKEVQPSRSARLGSKRSFRSQLSSSVEPAEAAWWRQLRPYVLVIVRSDPKLDNIAIVFFLPPAEARWEGVLLCKSFWLKIAS